MGKTDNTMQQYMCKSCRLFIEVLGMSKEDQETIAEEAFE